MHTVVSLDFLAHQNGSNGCSGLSNMESIFHGEISHFLENASMVSMWGFSMVTMVM